MSGRRDIKFESFEDVIADMKQLAAGEHEATGNHSFEKIINHLTRTNQVVIGKVPMPKLPF